MISQEAVAVITVVIAIVSLIFSAGTLGWTIYRDAIQKPRFRTSVAIKTIVQRDQLPDGPHIFVEALNLGPIPNRIGLVWVRPGWLTRRLKGAGAGMVYPDFAHRAATTPTSKIEVGDAATFVIPYGPECFLRHRIVDVGVTDGFGRTHWAPRKQVRKAREQFKTRFPDVPEVDIPQRRERDA